MWEEHGKGRVGIEAHYTGAQALDDNPYGSGPGHTSISPFLDRSRSAK